MPSTTMRSPTSSSQLVAEHLKASKKVMKEVLKSKASARAFLVEAGILDKKTGKLSKHYRAD